MLEALGRLGREPEGPQFVEVLRHHAPTWLVQLPALVGEEELETLHRKVAGTTRERMLREIVEALAVLTAETPLILVFEDLQWSDHSTIDCLAYLVRYREHMRLVVVGTYRLAEVIAKGHPLRRITQELQAHRLCDEMRLELLTEKEVAACVAKRLDGKVTTAKLGR